MAVMMKSAAGQKMGLRSTNARLPLASRPALHPVRAQQERNDQPAPDAKVEMPVTGVKVPLNRQKEPQSSLPPPVDNSQAKTFSTLSPTFPQVMGFWGAPEIINGRLAMLGFTAALAAELSTGWAVTSQFKQTPTLVLVAAGTLILASLIPFWARRKPDVIGPFTPTAELVNGRAAMIGFAALVFWEVVRHQALF